MRLNGADPDLWARVRDRLRAASVPDDAVLLPGDDGLGWEGALRVAVTPEGTWTLGTIDYGRERLLLRRSDHEALAEALASYLLTPLPAAEHLPPAEIERLQDWAAPHLLDLMNRAGTALVIDAPAGLLLDRIGALDGYLLFPSGTSFEARSLPVPVLQQPLHAFVTATTIRMEVAVTPPWFGHTGGGLRFAIVEPGVGVRDLVREGNLSQLDSSTPAEKPRSH